MKNPRKSGGGGWVLLARDPAEKMKKALAGVRGFWRASCAAQRTGYSSSFRNASMRAMPFSMFSRLVA